MTHDGGPCDYDWRSRFMLGSTRLVGAGLCAGPREGAEALPYKRRSIDALVVGVVVAAVALTPALRAQDSPTYTHDPIKIGKKKTVVGKGRAARKIESVSQYCLECHGDEDQAGEAPKPAHSVGSAENSHPTDVFYPGEKSGYVDTEKLDPRLALQGGRVSCITCHDVGDSRHKLVIPPSGGELCTACHER